jgi:hypothetical protein
MLAHILFFKYGPHPPLNRQTAVDMTMSSAPTGSAPRRPLGAAGEGHPRPCPSRPSVNADRRLFASTGLCRPKAAGGGVLLSAQWRRRSPRAAFGRLCYAGASMNRTASRDRSLKPRAGCTRGASSSNWSGATRRDCRRSRNSYRCPVRYRVEIKGLVPVICPL